jgi:hypothetical protein
MNPCCQCGTTICRCGGFVHPTILFNPPGLSRIAYRVGEYGAFRRALLQSLPGETELSITQNGVTIPLWQPSGHGDLALQMMEWWAYLADVLTFYNQRIATQAYLGTADLPESVNGLVRLLGYRPRPGIGGTGLLAALSNTPQPFTLPKGFAIQSKPGPGQQPRVFELAAATAVGVSPTSPVSLEQRTGAAVGSAETVNAAQSGVVIDVVTDVRGALTSTLSIAGRSSAVKKGDMVLVLPTGWPTAITSSSFFGIASVSAVTTVTDPTLGAITRIAVAWKGTPSLGGAGSPTAWQLLSAGTSAPVWQYPAAAGWVVSSGSPATVHLQGLARGIQADTAVVLQFGSPVRYQLLSTMSSSETLWYANPPGTDPRIPQGNGSGVPSIPMLHTALTLGSAVNATISGINDGQAQRVQELVWHSWKAIGDLVGVAPYPKTVGGDGAATPVTLQLPASIAQLSLATAADGTLPVLVVDSVGQGAAGRVTPPDPVAGRTAVVTLTPPVPRLIPPIQTYFNVLPVSRGKTVPRETLGSGDATRAAQAFTLQNTPVTYLQDAASVSGTDYSSTVRIWVNGVEWSEVQSFYGQPADAQVFVTHEDDAGKTHVGFGDGLCGARLPTGIDNVVASYRYGSGAAAPAAGTLTAVLKPWPGLRSVVNPVVVGGGADPDPPSKIRALAPRSVLTLGRAVSADDFQVIAAQAPGVTRAAAAFGFDPIQQRPRVTVWVGDDQNAVASATRAIAATADPNRLPAVTAATRVPITVSLSIAVSPRYQPETVRSALYAALLDPDAGLFGVNHVGIGEVVFDSQIYAACLAVAGVAAVHDLNVETATRFRPRFPVRRRPSLNACGQNRHDPGAGRYFFLADDGAALTLSVAAT